MLISRIEEIQVFDDCAWNIFKFGGESTSEIVKIAKVGQIYFIDIVDYSIHRDELYLYPHIFRNLIIWEFSFLNIYSYINEKTFEYFEKKIGEKSKYL